MIDTHTHIWPDAIARKALGGAPTELRRFGDGTTASLLESMHRSGVARSVCLSVAPTAGTVEAANRFASGLVHPLMGFGAIHPDLTPEDNLASLRRHGLRGVKVHPVFQHFSLADPRLMAVLDAIADEFVVVVHVGRVGFKSLSYESNPQMLADLVRNLPHVRLIACHFGGYLDLAEAEDSVIGLPIYLDTSWPPGLATLEPNRIARLIARHGPDRVCFASDWPMSDPKADLQALERLPLPSDVIEGIRGANFARLVEPRP